MQNCVYYTPVRDVADLKQCLTETCRVLLMMLSINGGRDFGPA